MTRWSPLLLGCLLIAGLFLAPSAARAADDSFHFTPGEVLLFETTGGGHGVGMSQWGARGRALAGQDADQILAAYYTGTTVTAQGDDSSSIRVLLPSDQVVDLPFSQYLPSVVSSELGPNWPPATLRAQAIASRTYARWNLTPDRPFDVMSTVQSQVYGTPARADATAAVAATAAQVLTYQGKIIPAFFHACSPTWTANNEDVWPGAPLPFLRAIHDVAPDGILYAQGCPYVNRLAGPFSTEELSQLLAANPATAVGNLQTLVYGPRDAGGRLLRVTLVGDAGTRTVSADTFRAVISNGQPHSRLLLSADFTVVKAPPGTPAPPVAPQPSPSSRPATPSSPSPATPLPTIWLVTTRAGVSLQSVPQRGTPAIVVLPQGAPLLLLAPSHGPWESVRDPANGKAGYVATQDLVTWSPVTATPVPSVAPAGPAAPVAQMGGFQPYWVENFAPAQLWSGTDAQAISFGPVAQWTLMQVLAPAVNGRYLVRIWNTGGDAYVDGALVGPAGAPSSAVSTDAASATPSKAPDMTASYTVKRGDTLFSIARRLGVSVTALSQTNGLTDPNDLVAGRQLRLP